MDKVKKTMIYTPILIRYTGEFGVKSIQSQEYFEDLLHNNIRRSLNTKNGRGLLDRITFVSRQGRLYINFEKEKDADVKLSKKYPGFLLFNPGKALSGFIL